MKYRYTKKPWISNHRYINGNVTSPEKEKAIKMQINNIAYEEEIVAAIFERDSAFIWSVTFVDIISFSWWDGVMPKSTKGDFIAPNAYEILRLFEFLSIPLLFFLLDNMFHKLSLLPPWVWIGVWWKLCIFWSPIDPVAIIVAAVMAEMPFLFELIIATEFQSIIRPQILLQKLLASFRLHNFFSYRVRRHFICF